MQRSRKVIERLSGWRQCLLWLSLAAVPGPSPGAVSLSFSIGEVTGDDWRIAGIELQLLSEHAGQMRVSITLDELRLPQGQGRLRGLQLECAVSRASGQDWQCSDGRLRLAASPLAAQDAAWTGRFRDPGEWQLQIEQLAVGSGQIQLRLAHSAGAWDARVRGERLPLSVLTERFPQTGLPRDWGLQGNVSATLLGRGDATGVTALEAQLALGPLDYADPSGRQAAEQLVINADAELQRLPQGWQFDIDGEVPQGALYSEPLFLDAGDSRLGFGVSGEWARAGDMLTLDTWTASAENAVALSGTGRIRVTDRALQQLTVVARSDDAGRLYSLLLQPFLIGSAADDLEVSGRLGTVLHFDADGLEQAGLELNGLSAVDRAGRFALHEASGGVAWDRRQQVPASLLEISSASVYRIPTGAFRIQAQFYSDRVVLLQPVVVPVLGGEVALDAFDLSGALPGGEAARWQADASVRAVSLEQLTELLQWPPFAGTINGQLRDMRYQDQRLTIGGGLKLQAFDGEIAVRDLAIEQPLGTVPSLRAEADLRGLSLESLTQTFAFGRIEGRLDGDIDDIRLLAWEPDQFALHLFTPPGDDSRHRISQRAVQNLTELGSGVPAGLSATFLRIFEDFNYDRIDIRITLQGDVAELDGLARPDGGYYLVRGAGLPRIDVIGRNRSVAWKDLLERLQQIRVDGMQIE